jgi:hypothetical protein
MRRILWCATVGVFFVLPAKGWSQQTDQKAGGPSEQAQTSRQSSTATAATASALPSAPQQDSIAEAARKLREQKKDTPKTAKVFTNDNLPTQGGISSVGQGSEAPAPSDGSAIRSGAATGKDEKMWRDKFAQLHHKLEQDQANRDVMQRELGVDNVQFYADPVKQMQQGYTNSDINKKRSDIGQMDKQIAADQQAITGAEEELRKSGGDSGWSR